MRSGQRFSSAPEEQPGSRHGHSLRHALIVWLTRFNERPGATCKPID
ncbi:hypothetical protein PG5_48280 [Pseudomonas sp. G5(2012)]|nr:hypothetical protein PG5_48280 [Pseudomonas sp. G5(2012)]